MTQKTVYRLNQLKGSVEIAGLRKIGKAIGIIVFTKVLLTQFFLLCSGVPLVGLYLNWIIAALNT